MPSVDRSVDRSVDTVRAQVPAPSEDPFYGPVRHLPTPGTLIRSRRVAVTHESVAAAWQVVHASTGSRRQRIAVSGTVLAPRAPWRGPGRRPVLSYGVGVHGLGRDAAPSHLLAVGTEHEIAVLAEALDLGWIVLVTDGDGLGMPGPHTYGAGLPGGHAMLDLVRAAGTVLSDVVDAPLVIWGYSEGGRCAAFAGELQPTYAPELPLVAVAAGGVPSDLREMAITLDGGPFSGLNLAVLVGLAHAHQDPALMRILSESGRIAAERAARLDVVGLIVELPQPLHHHTVRTEPWDEPVWRSLLARENAGQRRPHVPVLVYHVEDDELVPTKLGRRLYDVYRRIGTDVQWAKVAADNHLAGTTVGTGPALSWLSRQLLTHG